MNLTLQATLFGLTSSLTDRFPRFGAGLLDATLRPLVTHPWLETAFRRRNLAVLDRVGEPRRVVVLSDIHLGDAVMLQGLVIAVREFFPGAEIHYVVSRKARPFVAGHPDITWLWPVYSGAMLPTRGDFEAVRDVIASTHCDLVVNASPFFVPGRPLPKATPVLDFLTHAPRLVRNESHPTEPNHFLFQSHRFLTDLFVERQSGGRPADPKGARIFLDDEAVDEADRFIESLGADASDPRVLVNPDGASPCTRPPETVMSAVVRRLVEGGAFVLVGEGHTDAGVGIRIRDRLPAIFLGRTGIVPASMRAPAYAALLDRMDLFVSGDTGPLHWGAARKVSRTGRRLFSNRTAVFSLFGATPPRMSGYDSLQAGFLPAWQDAPSRAFVSHAPCLNITCLNKLHKSCRYLRCFEGAAPLSMADTALEYLERACPIHSPRPMRIPA